MWNQAFNKCLRAELCTVGQTKEILKYQSGLFMMVSVLFSSSFNILLTILLIQKKKKKKIVNRLICGENYSCFNFQSGDLVG